MSQFQFVIYKITFPNGKIYVGKDVAAKGHSVRYFGSWNTDLVENDFTKSELSNFTLKKEILFESSDVKETSRQEAVFIVSLRSNDPNIGYNRSPKFREA